MTGAIYKRGTDGSPAVRLGEGRPLDLSPDGLWALAMTGGPDTPHLILLPTGAGQPRDVPTAGIQVPIFGKGAALFPDGKRLLIRGSEKGSPMRLYVLDLETGTARAITSEISLESAILVSPDGKSVASSEDGKTVLYDVESRAARNIPGLPEGLYAIKWCADAHSLFVRTTGIKPLKVYRLDFASGRLDLWREFSVADIGSGLIGVIPTPDGKSYVYGYDRYFSDLFIAEGIK
jgi:Tol biopolymer transport system component